MKPFKKSILMICMAALTAAFVSCAGNKGSETPSDAPELTFSVSRTTFSDDSPLADELRKKTGINIKFIPGYNDYSKILSLYASSSMPDIIDFPWKDFPGGPEKALSSGIIYPLNDVINQHCPNFKNYIENNPQVYKDTISDSGQFYAFPFIRENEKLKTYTGPIFRSDWLKELGLPIPKTLSEWENALCAFKEIKKAEIPYVDFNNTIAGAFGITEGFYLDGNTICYGPCQSQYKDYIELMARWYRKGLINNIYSIDTASVKQLFASNRVGATCLPVGSGMGQIYDIAEQQNKSLEITAVPYPVLQEGDVNKFGHYDNGYCQFAISRNCKSIETAAKFLDYGYSREGMLTYNFGIKNKSYVEKDGKPRYTPLITDNREKNIFSTMNDYVMAHMNGPFIQMKDYLDQYLKRPEQKQALKMWSGSDYSRTTIPQITFIDSELNEIVVFKENIDEYVTDMKLKFILGIEPIENFDIFTKTLYSLGVEKYIEIYQNAYNRYLKRDE